MRIVSLIVIVGVALFASSPDRAVAVEIVAHRGASHDAPENTLSAVNLAWKQNADAVEIDVYLTRDNQIVVYHDKTTKRIGGRDTPIENQTLAELRTLDVGGWKGRQWKNERIPTLEDVLATIPPGKRLFIEIKDGPELVPALALALKLARKQARQTAVISFSYEVVQSVKQQLPHIEVYWIVKFKQSKVTRKWTPKIGEVVAKTKRAGLDGVDLNNCPAVNRASVAAVRAAGLGFYVWTVNDPGDARRLQALGIDGITTDRPGWLRGQLQQP